MLGSRAGRLAVRAAGACRTHCPQGEGAKASQLDGGEGMTGEGVAEGMLGRACSPRQRCKA